ncbi:uncharacterized protein LOC116123675 [Pistacia vera]|uniref:uncharacterized protein LOC116123675 n=1 Tax=Pistacia vera TaxID=55513 RepID=UPI001263A116|nr:uncharacterized protein LOC116123675 [Pistacia vera]
MVFVKRRANEEFLILSVIWVKEKACFVDVDEVKSISNAKVSLETVGLFRGVELLVTEKELRDSNWYSIKDYWVECLESDSKNVGYVDGGVGQKGFECERRIRRSAIPHHSSSHSSPQHIFSGRQHGMVRTYKVIPSPWNPTPDTRFVNKFDSPPTSRLFTKVPSKPTNHSKFTGKCGKPRCVECHMHPACKSKDKTKGTQKFNSRDLVSNYKSITWRVTDGRPGLNYSGFSATGILDHLGSDYGDEEVDDNGSDV